MTKVRTFSRVFPSYHPRKGEDTYFVEKIWNSMPNLDFEEIGRLNRKIPKNIFDDFIQSLQPIEGEKHHTIRAGHHFKPGDTFSPRVWSGKPYNSPQIIIAPDITVEKTWDYEVKLVETAEWWVLNGRFISDYNYYMQQWTGKELLTEIAKNDGLSLTDFLDWFKHPSPFSGQIICWNKDIEY